MLFWDNKMNRLGGGYFEFSEPRAHTSTENNKQNLQKVSITEVSEVVRPMAIFFIVGLKNYPTPK